MENTYFTVVTDSGTKKMFEALNEEKKVSIAEFAVGDGGGTAYLPTKEMEALKNEVWRGSVKSCYVSEESENLLITESVIPSDVGGFTIREMGIFDAEGTLIAICNTPETQKVRITDGVVHEMMLSMEIALSNTDSVELIVDPAVVTATKKDVERLENRIERKIEEEDSALYSQSTGYTNTKIAELINGAPSTLDTLGEIAQAMQENENVVDALEAAMGSKAPQAELDGHTGNSTIHITASERAGWNNKLEKTGDASNTTAAFTQASSLANISTGEKISTIMGKVSKAIATLISHVAEKATGSKFGHVKLSDTYKSAVSNGAAANGVGASQKALADAYSALNSNLADSLGGLTFGVDADGNPGYIKAGADTVTPFKTEGTKIYGSASGSNTWTVNIKRNNPVLKLTGEGYIGNSPNNHVTLGIYGATEDYTTPYHGKLPQIQSISLYANMPTVEVDVSAYPRLVIYAIYGTATVDASTRINFLLEN